MPFEATPVLLSEAFGVDYCATHAHTVFLIPLRGNRGHRCGWYGATKLITRAVPELYEWLFKKRPGKLTERKSEEEREERGSQLGKTGDGDVRKPHHPEE